MLRIAPFRQLLHPVMKPSLTTLRYAHAPTNTPQNTPSNGDALGSRITEKQTSATSPQTYGDPTPKESKTGTFNRGESSQYSSEMTKSGTHQEIVESTPEAAFDPKVTSPDQVKQTAGREVCRKFTLAYSSSILAST